MVALTTPKVETGWKAFDFVLPGTDGREHMLDNVRGSKGLVVMFISNHCPYVRAIMEKLVRDMAELQKLGIGVVAIASNDVRQYPEDGMHNMKEVAKRYKFTFPYIFDESQEIARAYDAVCTPDFFGFNSKLELQYRGRLDDSGMNKKQGNKRELFEAMKLIAATGKGPEIQNPSIGCSIKWKEEAFA